VKPRFFADPNNARTAGARSNKRTEAKLAQLARLAEAKRGTRENPLDPRWPLVAARIQAALGASVTSKAGLARWAGVTGRTLNRWLAGESLASGAQVDAFLARLAELDKSGENVAM